MFISVNETISHGRVDLDFIFNFTPGCFEFSMNNGYLQIEHTSMILVL